MVVKRFISLEGKKFSMPEEFYYILKECKNRVNQKLDAPIIITGSVGSGKSNLEFGFGGIWEEIFYKRPFTLNNIHFRAEKLTEETNRSDNFTHFIGFDEAIQGGSSRDGSSKIGNTLRKTLITKRYKKHCICACVDSLKELNDKIIERCIVWFHVHYQRLPSGRFRKGRVKMFSSAQALKVYEDLKAKKVMSTEKHYIWMKNRKIIDTMCYENIWFSETDYDNKKTKETNLIDNELSDRNKKFMGERDKLIMFLIENKFKQNKIAKVVGLSTTAIQDIKNKYATSNQSK